MWARTQYANFMPRRFDRASPPKVPVLGVNRVDFLNARRSKKGRTDQAYSRTCTTQRAESSDCDSKTADKSCKSGDKREIRCRAATERHQRAGSAATTRGGRRTAAGRRQMPASTAP